jgi:ribosomal protein S18 acetylase RimI-like enzyme
MAEIVEYAEGGVELLEWIGPLWLELRDHHALVSAYFNDEIAQMTFAQRMEQLEGKAEAGELRVDVARIGEARVGYCVSSIDRSKRGEIDSLFVRAEARGRGIGGELMRRAMDWLDEHSAVDKRLAVAAGNEEVMGFYRKYGFWPREIILRQKRP